jgi:type I restriction enzyme S subunit
MSSRHAKRYAAYKESGVEWIGEVPAHWEVKRLKELGKIQNSNVDKKTYPDEKAVRLCNYVDVYKNEFINSHLLQEFMLATADEFEILKFAVKENDVLITKDSETADDIAIPALVTETLDGVLCGYHLAQIRTNSKKLLGPYLFRLFQSNRYNSRFEVSAKGITRVGLGQSAISDALTPVPPLPEQTAIAAYLDTITMQIDRQAELLNKKATQYGKLKQSLINETVTRGLDSSVPMKESGVEWIGEVPAHWKLTRNKEIFYERGSLSKSGEETLLTVSHITGVTRRSEKNVNMFMAETMEGYKHCKKDDLIINTMWAWMGAIGTAREDGICSPAYGVYAPRAFIAYNPSYFEYSYRTPKAVSEMTRLSKGIVSSRLRLYPKDFFQILTALPSITEQTAIAAYLDTKTAQIDRIVSTISNQIDKLKELRKTLINDVVTGKIKVIPHGELA